MSTMVSGAARKPAKYALFILAAVAAAVCAGTASADAPSDNVPSIVVKYDGAMLATDSGVRTLYRRLNTAAAKVCVDRGIDRFVSDAVLACRKQAVERAVRQIGNAQLAALQESRTKSG
jgi:UrcA family protein